MKKNMGSIDRAIRTTAALILIVLLYFDKIHGTTGIIASVIAMVFLATSLIGYCPIYSALKLSTRKWSLHKNNLK
ncbi:MAG: DUF2892 domain-containing protein [Chryseolinea sp.]